MIQGIKNIIFDLGGVILDIDYQKTVDAFRDLGFPAFNREFIQSLQSDFFQEFEKGTKSEEDFYHYLSAKSTVPITRDDMDKAWNAMLLEIPLRRLQILQQLQIHYNTFLLSNTNIIHQRAFEQTLKAVCGFSSFSVFFDRVYLSHRIGMRKPDAEIFRFVLDECQLNASETLFIDDSEQHVHTAQQLGIRTIHLRPGMTIEKDVFRTSSDRATAHKSL